MSLIAGRLNDLIRDAKDQLNYDRVEEIAAVLRASGQYGSEAAEVAADVLAANFVLSGPDAENARYLSARGNTRGGAVS